MNTEFMKRLIPKKKIILLAIVLASIFIIGISIPASAADGDDYWWAPVAGSGTGNYSDVNHWSSTNDGTGGDYATAPNSTNPVHFGSAAFTGAGQVVTIDAASDCLSLDFTGATNTPTLAGTFNLSIYGNLTFISGMNITLTGNLVFRGNTSSADFAGKSLAAGMTLCKTVGQTLDLASNIAASTSYYIVFGQGVLDTNNYAITGNVYQEATYGATVLNLGSSVITVTGWNIDATNVTVNAGTSTINVTGTGQFAGGGETYYRVALNGTNQSVTGNNTFYDFTRNGDYAGILTLPAGGTQTITNNMALIGQAVSTGRLLVCSSVLGTASTLNAAATASTVRVDFMDITAAGAGNWNLSAITGGSGDCGGNTGITFTTPAAHTWNGTTGSWSDSTKWSPATVPLPQDDVSAGGTGNTITVDIARIGKSVTFTGTSIISLSNSINVYGSLIIPPGLTWTHNAKNINLSGRSNASLTSSGKDLNGFYIANPGAILSLNDDLIQTGKEVRLSVGGLDLNDRNLTCGFFQSNYTTTRTLSLGSGVFTLTVNGDVVTSKWGVGTTNLTFNAETSTIIYTGSNASGQTFAGAGLTYNNITITGSGNYTATITGNNTFNVFNVDRSTGPLKTITVTPGTTQTFSGFVSQTNGTNLLTLNTGGATATWAKAGGGTVQLDYLDITDVIASPATTWYYGNNSAVHGTTTNWATSDVYRYKIGGSGNWTDTGMWSTASGGAGGATVPSNARHARFDVNSFSGAGQSLVIDSTAHCLDMDWTGVLYTPTLANGADVGINIYGNLTTIANMHFHQITTSFVGTTILTSNTQDFHNSFFVIGGTVSIQGSLSVLNIAFNGGTVTTNNNTVTCSGYFNTGTTTAKTLTLGSSIINCTSWNYTGTNLTLTANTSTINVTGTGAFAGGAITTYNNINLLGTAHTVSGAFTCNNFTRQGTATKTDSVTFTSGTTFTATTSMTFAGNSVTNRLLVQSSTLGSVATLSAGNFLIGTAQTANADFMDIARVGAPYSLATIPGGSGDCGGNSGFTFTTGATQTSTGAGNWSGSIWSGRNPLPQDDVSVSHNVTVDMPRIGKSVTFTGTPTVILSNSVSNYGSLTFVTGMTYTPGAFRHYFRGRGAYTINTAGKNLYGLHIYCPGGTYTLQGNLTYSSGYILELANGTIDFNDYNVSGGIIQSVGTATRGISLGNGTITLGYTLVGSKWDFATTTGLTFNAEGSTIILSNSTADGNTFAGGGFAYNNVTVAGAGNYNLTVTGNNTFNTFKVDASLAAKTVTATGTTQTVSDFDRDNGGTNIITLVNGTWTKGANVAIPISQDYLSVSGSTANPVDIWYAGAHSIDGGGNTRWLFTDPALTIGTDAVTGVTMDKDGVTGGTFHGTINELDGEAQVDYYFEYGLTNLYGSVTGTATVYGSTIFADSVPNSLVPGSTYHCRAVGTNGNVASPFLGNDITFVFTMPSITTTGTSNLAVTNLGVTSGNFVGNITNMGVATTTYVSVDYGFTNAYGFTTPTVTRNAIGPINVPLPSNLEPGAIYHFRVNVINGATTVNGNDVSFKMTPTTSTDGNNFAKNIIPIVAIVVIIGFAIGMLYVGLSIPGLVLLAIGIMIAIGFVTAASAGLAILK